MTNAVPPARGLSPLNNRLLTILLAAVLTVIVVIVAGVVLLTVLATRYRALPPHHSVGMLVTRSVVSPHYALSPRAALPTQPITAARDLVHTVGGVQLPCYPHNVKQWYLASRGCPVSAHFRRYLLNHMRDIDPICKCQNFPIRSSFHLLFQRPRLAGVMATLTFYYNKVYIVFVETRHGAGWLVTANYVTHS